jgi:predicted GIY-YIG superfamily endonuclease
MTNSDIESVRFDNIALSNWATENPRRKNWPVVYTINNETEIYVGETTNAELRMKQHLVSPTKQHLKTVNVIIDDSFNKSVCLDLESHLIKYFHADEKYLVLNGNGGITDSDYFKRSEYRKAFEEIFEKLIASGQLTRTIPELVNSDLFKYSPFKALTTDQAIAVETILELLLDSEVSGQPSRPIVVQGDPGTGKTIVAVYLMKLLSDIARSGGEESLDTDSLFSDFFRPGYRTIGTHDYRARCTADFAS